MKRLVADSGSTKTDWCIYENGAPIRCEETAGINPVHQTEEEIDAILNKVRTLLYKGMPPERFDEIAFYGAGCGLPEMQKKVRQRIAAHLGVTVIDVESDLLGAARILCQGEAGIACILGTGSNSCEFDGHRIVANTPALGYILGDEGSGAALGRELINHWMKGLFDEGLCRLLTKTYGLTQADIIRHVYREPMANRWLAGFAPFLSQHREHPAIQTLLRRCFGEFFRRNVTHYDHSLPVHFVGSVAHHFREELAEAAHEEGMTLGRIRQKLLRD